MVNLFMTNGMAIRPFIWGQQNFPYRLACLCWWCFHGGPHNCMTQHRKLKTVPSVLIYCISCFIVLLVCVFILKVSVILKLWMPLKAILWQCINSGTWVIPEQSGTFPCNYLPFTLLLKKGGELPPAPPAHLGYYHKYDTLTLVPGLSGYKLSLQVSQQGLPLILIKAW